jgi:hypothetical protein
MVHAALSRMVAWIAIFGNPFWQGLAYRGEHCGSIIPNEIRIYDLALWYFSCHGYVEDIVMTELTPQQLEEVKQHLLNGAKIEAIKVYRSHAHCDLVTAKTAVDQLQTTMQADLPEMSAKSRSGCMGMVMFGVGLLGTMLWTASRW